MWKFKEREGKMGKSSRVVEGGYRDKEGIL